MSESLVSVVIVTWNCRRYVEECLTSLGEHLHVPSEIIVVDNSSTDGTTEMIEHRFPGVQMLQTGCNLGFAKGNNLGIKKSRSRYVALINPDVQILEGCFDRALATIESDKSIGMLGPAMVDRYGRVRRSGMRFPSLWNALCDALCLHRLFGPLPILGGQLMADFRWNTPRDVDVLNGWFWLIRREAIEEVGLLDDQFFMYGEDLDWCKRFANAGWRRVFEPDALAIHYGGGSSQREPLRFYLEMQLANLQYWQKHHGSIKRAFYAGILWIHHFVRMVGYAFLFVSRPHDGQAGFKLRRHSLCLSRSLSQRRANFDA